MSKGNIILSRVFIFLTCFMPFAGIKAQLQNSAYVKYIKLGDKHFNKENYIEAEKQYRFAYDSLAKTAETQSRLGVVLTFTNKYHEAIPLLNPIVDTAKAADYYMRHRLAHAYHQLSRFDEAMHYYAQCLADTTQLGLKSKLGLKQCKLGKQLAGQTAENVWVTRLDTVVNSGYNDIAPKFMFDSLLLFNSLRNDQTGLLNVFSSATNNLYYSIVSENEYAYAQPLREIEKSVLTESISNYQFIGRYPAPNNLFIYSDTVNKKLVLSDYLAIKTTPVQSTGLFFNNMGATTAVLLNNGQMAYFVKSNNDGGHWKKDIFSAQKDSSGQWINIVKLPPPYNSEANEDALFWDDKEHTLYFSSNRHETVGGYDIFVCETDSKGALLPPKNIGFPINTPANDLFFFKEGPRAWYTSDIGVNKHDIYEVWFNEKPELPKVQPPVNAPDLPWYQKYMDIAGVIPISEHIYLQNLYFNNNQTNIDTLDEAYRKLLNTLLTNKNVVLKFTAYTDWYGSKALNEKVSFLRVSNLYYHLFKKGVAANQIQLQFRGGREYRTITEFDDYNDRRTARRANRCITIEPVKQASPYVMVTENNEFKRFTKQVAPQNFAVMLYVALTDTEDIGIENIKKTYIEQHGVYIYHTPFVETIEKAKQELEKLAATYKGAYVFELSIK